MGDHLDKLNSESDSTTLEERPDRSLLTGLSMTPLPAPASATTDLQPDSIDADARTVYNYHRMNLPLFPPSQATTAPSPSTGTTHDIIPADIKHTTAIFTLCSLDIRVAHHAASLFLSGSSTKTPQEDMESQYSFLIFSGKVGALTANHHHFPPGRPEARVFADIALSAPYHIPRDKILIEPEATNTGENVRFTHNLLSQRGLLDGSGPEKIKITRFILVQKPYMERRTFATFVRQWPAEEANGQVQFTVTSPPLSWQDYPDADNPRDLVISIMVGDLVRIREYPAKGYQIEQHIPDEVWEAGQRLIKAGYASHLP